MAKTVMRSARSAKGFVYVVSATNGYVKIGKAGNPYERFTMHQCNSPLILTLCYVCECSDPVGVEEATHEGLAEHRRHREWFEVPSDIAVEALRGVLKARGVQTEPAPHRNAGVGAPATLHALINERAIAAV